MNNRKFAAGVPLRHRLTGIGFAMLAGASLYAIGSIGNASAQSTGGQIFGQGPAGATVSVHSNSGAHRHVTIKDDGRYTIRSLPLGTYSVSLEKDGKDVDTRRNIPLSVGRGAEVDFACPQDQCAKAK